MRVGSLFSGIGGFDLGFERAGMTLAWHAETDDAASRVLAHHWPEVDNLGDVTSVGVQVEADAGPRRHLPGSGSVAGSRGWGTEASRVDLLCGGFPCQDLSVAGRRAGLSGERSGLFYEFARIADELRPTWVVIENVPGLLSSNDGRDMGTLLNVLADLGYADLAWRVVDSLGFGVPQRRRRLFVVGRVGAGACAGEVLLECEGSPWRPPSSGQAGPGTAATLTAGVSSGRGVNPPGRRNEDDVNLVARTVDVNGRYDRGDGTDNLIAASITASAGHHGHSSPRGDGSDNIVPVGFDATASVPVNGAGYSQTLRVGSSIGLEGNAATTVGSRVRRLTPVECERLQGFPDGWTEPASSDSARYRCLGNAVTVPVAAWLGGRIVRVESERLGGAA